LDGHRFGKVPAANVTQILQGKVPGADVRQNSGVPGGDMQLTLRGVTTLLGPISPLYVVDGVIMSNESAPSGIGAVTGGYESRRSRIVDLNPNDVASIEVLKGAAASAMYGSKGSNGVVVITTKRGRN
jgi:TonB-dependent SusC/RagA subfamily outer membrane receptor